MSYFKDSVAERAILHHFTFLYDDWNLRAQTWGNWMVIYSSGAVIKCDDNDDNGKRVDESCG